MNIVNSGETVFISLLKCKENPSVHMFNVHPFSFAKTIKKKQYLCSNGVFDEKLYLILIFS